MTLNQLRTGPDRVRMGGRSRARGVRSSAHKVQSFVRGFSSFVHDVESVAQLAKFIAWHALSAARVGGRAADVRVSELINEMSGTMEQIKRGEKVMSWDGDALAGQMEDVLERQQAIADARAVRGSSTAEERGRSAQFESMRVSRSRIMTQLTLATHPSHRSMLERALQSINDQMAADEKRK